MRTGLSCRGANPHRYKHLIRDPRNGNAEMLCLLGKERANPLTKAGHSPLIGARRIFETGILAIGRKIYGTNR